MEQPHPSPHSSPRGSVSSPPVQIVAAMQPEMATMQEQVTQLVQWAMAQDAQQKAAAAAAAAPVVNVSPPPSLMSRHLPKIRSPSGFGGVMGFAVDDYLREMEQQFAYYGGSFPDDATKVRFAASFLDRVALQWWEQQHDRDAIKSWPEFVARIRQRFRPVQAAMLARQRLGKLRMRDSVNAYAGAFQTVLAPISDMGDADQVHHFIHGLTPWIAGKVWERHPETLKDAIDFAVSVEAMGQFGRAAMGGKPFTQSGGRSSTFNHGPSSSSYSGGQGGSVPMDLNHLASEVDAHLAEGEVVPSSSTTDPMSALLSKLASMELRLNAIGHRGGAGASRHVAGANFKPGEIAKLMQEGRCFRCKQKGHMKNECPALKPGSLAAVADSKSKNE